MTNEIDHLKIIANPYKLKKYKNISFKNKEVSINNILYEYIEKKYKNIYIHHTLYYEIIESIDDIVNEYIIKDFVNELLNKVIDKFDKIV